MAEAVEFGRVDGEGRQLVGRGARGVGAEDEEEAERRAREGKEGEGQAQHGQVRDDRAVLDQVEVGETARDGVVAVPQGHGCEDQISIQVC